MVKIELTDDQFAGLLKLIDAEMAENVASEDEAYNTFWLEIRNKFTLV